MRPIFKIAIYLMLLVLLTAEDCSDNYSESQQTDRIEIQMFQELEDNFISEDMDAAHLKALEKRAVQKVQELVDYLNIYADTGLDIQFRQQARQMITEDFILDTDLQDFLMKHEMMEDLENSVLLNAYGGTASFSVESVQLHEPFEQSQNSEYKSQLTYQFQNSNIVLGVSATKTTKYFGNEKLDVWELFFEL